MTIGQRIAQKRKELGLSQESLGNQLGVSRQSIYKWESDAAVPEIDKLITLSRLFGVSVGWLLGVEEAPQAGPQTAPEGAGPAGAPEEADLTEAQLHMVEEIVERYTAALPRPQKSPWGKWDVRLLFAACGMILAIVFGVSSKVNRLDTRYDSLQNDISRIESSVNGQIGSISNRVEEILKAQNSLVADYGAEIVSANLQENRVVFSVRAVPKTYEEGMTITFSVDNGTGGVNNAQGQPSSGNSFTGTLACGLTDSIALSAVLETPDGTRQTQLLEQYNGLYSDSLPSVDVMNYDTDRLLGLPCDERGLLTLPEIYGTIGPGSTVSAVNEAIGQAELDSVRLGLFKNKTLVTWLEPCEQPENFHGDYTGQSFFHLPEGLQVTLNEHTEELCFAAVVTDTYGREAVYSDIPYILQNGALTWPTASDISDHDPANWHYSTP